MGNLSEFETYLQHLCEALGHTDRNVGLKDYCRGLMLPIKRKSIEPLAAHTDPLHVAAKHQSPHHFVAKSSGSDAAVLSRVRDWVLPTLGINRVATGSLTTRAFPRRASTQPVWLGNTVGHWGNKTTAKWPSVCRWPASRAASLLRTHSTCPKIGRPIPCVARQQACLQR